MHSYRVDLDISSSTKCNTFNNILIIFFIIRSYLDNLQTWKELSDKSSRQNRIHWKLEDWDTYQIVTAMLQTIPSYIKLQIQ